MTKTRLEYRYGEAKQVAERVKTFKQTPFFSALKLEGENRGLSYDVTEEGKTIIEKI